MSTMTTNTDGKGRAKKGKRPKRWQGERKHPRVPPVPEMSEYHSSVHSAFRELINKYRGIRNLPYSEIESFEREHDVNIYVIHLRDNQGYGHHIKPTVYEERVTQDKWDKLRESTTAWKIVF